MSRRSSLGNVQDPTAAPARAGRQSQNGARASQKTVRIGVAKSDTGARRRNARQVRSPLHENVLGTVRDLITQGEFPPGARLTERVLTERLHVSRTPLREALKVLAHEGLVELLPNCGARVTKLTADDVRHLFAVIGALEALAGKLACEEISAAELTELKAIHQQMSQHFQRRELPAYFRLNQVIHEHIVRAARNPILLSNYHLLCGRLRRARYQANQGNEKRWRAAMAEHEAMIDALERREGERLAGILQEHLHSKYEAICRCL